MRNYHAGLKPRKVRPYEPEMSSARLEQALSAVKLIATADPRTLYPPRHRNLLAIAIDDLADVGGKKNARYRSAEIWAAQEAKTLVRQVHEHVVERRWLVEQILADPAQYRQICMSHHATCLVTPEEDELLDEAARKARVAGAPLFGWDRYVAAGVTVIDAVGGQVAGSRQLSAALPEVPS